MISFEPFWNMLKERGISLYSLEYDYEFNPAEISRMKNGHNFTLKFIDRICILFHCQPKDIIIFEENAVKKPKPAVSSNTCSGR